MHKFVTHNIPFLRYVNYGGGEIVRNCSGALIRQTRCETNDRQTVLCLLPLTCKPLSHLTPRPPSHLAPQSQPHITPSHHHTVLYPTHCRYDPFFPRPTPVFNWAIIPFPLPSKAACEQLCVTTSTTEWPADAKWHSQAGSNRPQQTSSWKPLLRR